MRNQGPSPRSQVLARNPSACAAARRLFVDFDVEELNELAHADVPVAGAELVFHHHGERRRAEAIREELSAPDLHFGLHAVDPAARYDRIVLSLPQGREARAVIFTQAARRLTPGGILLVIGETRMGIRPAHTTLSELFRSVQSLDSARRCALLAASEPIPGDESPAAGLAPWLDEDVYHIAEVEVPIAALPGVFSHSHLDEGTQFLLETLDESAPARILDLGCGCGVIGAFAHRRWPQAHVDLVDASALAVVAARRTAELNKLDPKQVWASDVYSDVRGSYDLILSNPPFHQGRDTDWSVAERLVSQAAGHLNPGGRLRLVANLHLPYPRLLRASFNKWRVAEEGDRYLVYEAVAR